MTSQPWSDDDRLFDDLAAALRTVQPGSGRVRDLGVAAYTWHGVDEELEFAGLVFDSLLDPEPVLRAAPGDGDPRRTLLFKTESISVEIERTGDCLVGQVIPPQSGDISLVAASGAVAHAEVDELGCFSIDGLPREPVRFRWQALDVQLVTDWVRF